MGRGATKIIRNGRFFCEATSVRVLIISDLNSWGPLLSCFRGVRAMLFSILILFLFHLWISPSASQYITLGECPRVSGISNFNISRYEGIWYEVEKYWFLPEATASCTNVRYVANDVNGFGVEINLLEGISRTKISIPGVTWYGGRAGVGDFVLDLQITPSPIPFHFKYPYLVLDTDYSTYTVKYRCKQIGPISMQTMWILSRGLDFDAETREKIYNFLRSVGINVQKLRRSNTSTCKDITV